MSAPTDAGDDFVTVAGEYVVGTLDADERAAFATRLREDADARSAVAYWERRLASLPEHIEPATPSPDLWPRIEQALLRLSAKPTPLRVIPGGGVSAVDYRTSRNRWRAAAFTSGAMAAALLVFVAIREAGLLPTPQPKGTFVAAVNRGGDKPALIIRVDLATRQVLVRPIAAETPTGRSLQLWYIGDSGTPRSMGLVKGSAASIPLPTDVKGSGTFAVSVEPQGGSTTGSPTGPVVYSGTLIAE